MDLCIVRKSDGFMTMFTPSEVNKLARAIVKTHAPKGSKYISHWICADHATDETRVIAQYQQPDGWQSSVGEVLGR